ncbi:hypothetical protein D9619_012107 [Psilocybe cf. subviscida]|uniref:Major facilitator superfamily (MFS) profile domain-containing protein n=1 Tax=Psilocybe cf. subviscida TaxID=2480587 RepID=A0A8H5EZE4_9AGAR|nr:hypothetical protein D9619_012107 [Psilocybe cf. subviscida]
MSSEETPLLNDTQLSHDDVYGRFSPTRKRVILALVSGCGLLGLFVTGTFTPSIPQIAKDLDTTGAVVNQLVGIRCLDWRSYWKRVLHILHVFCDGRRPVYIYTLPVLVFGSLGVATASTVPSLLVWRFFQAFGGSPGLVLGAGAIGDIYRLEERGRAMGVFFAAILLGPAIAPIAGGTATYYFSWRFMQGSLGVMGLIAWLAIVFFFPETSQPGARGIDQLRKKEGQNYRPRFVFVNPLRPLALLRSPNLFLISVITSASLMSVFVLLIPLAYTIGLRYHIKNEALLGLCFLPAGLGNILGARIIGRISDRTVIQWREKRKGAWYPEDRLRAALIPFALVAPIPILVYGLVNQYVDGPLGLTTCLLCLFISGAGVEMCFGPCAAYLVDVMHARSAESLGANNGLRSVLMALGIAATLPMMDMYGIAATNAACAAFIWFAFGILVCIIRYGDQMRAWADVGFSTADNN